MKWLFEPEYWLALVSLTSIEIVLGIDNIIFISILATKLPKARQNSARLLGLSLAMVTRIGLLLSLTWVMGLTSTLFSVFGQEISGRDIVLILGGGFLLTKSTLEIHDNLEGPEETQVKHVAKSFAGIIVQIMLLDIVFSLDSIITAIGLANEVAIMVIAIIIATMVMLVSSAGISNFIETHPTVKILALSFLFLIGVSLLGEGFALHVPKGYIYFAMAFSFLVEMLNLKVRKRHLTPIKLKSRRQSVR